MFEIAPMDPEMGAGNGSGRDVMGLGINSPSPHPSPLGTFLEATLSNPNMHPAKVASVTATCLQIICALFTIVMLVQLSSVLVPLTFAVFLAFLVEPVLAAIVWAPTRVWILIQTRCRSGSLSNNSSYLMPPSTLEGGASGGPASEPRSGLRNPRQDMSRPLVEAASASSAATGAAAAAAGGSAPAASASASASSGRRRLDLPASAILAPAAGPPLAAAATAAAERAPVREVAEAEAAGGTPPLRGGEDHEGRASISFAAGMEVLASYRPCGLCWSRVRAAWDIASVLLCVVVCVGILGGVGVAFYASLDACDWQKYINSPRIAELQNWLKRMGISAKSWEDLLQHYKGEIADFAGKMISVIGDAAVTLLLFFFCLVALLPGIRQRQPKSRMRRLMQRYLICKSLSSAIIAFAVMFALQILGVDLVVVFGMITFFFNFIPNVGSLFAILIPAPFVYLSPGTTIKEVVLVVVIPFLIHNTFGCILEPSLMQAGLDLHPLTVVVALTFWGATWGIAGMILSVPLTCALRLYLQESSHPYAVRFSHMLDNPLGGDRKRSSRRRRRPSIGSSSSSHESAD